MGSYTPNYNLYMPSIGEQGWGNLVSNNFEILDTNLTNLQTQITTNLNNLQDQIDVIDTQINTINTNIGNGTRILSILYPSDISLTITSSNFGNYASRTNNVWYASFNNNTTFSSIPKPTKSCRLMIISVNGNTILSGNLDTYPTTLQSETPPNSSSTNTYTQTIDFYNDSYVYNPITLTYTANQNNSQLTMQYADYTNFIDKTIPITTQTNFVGQYTLSIPHAIASGGWEDAGTAGTASNTCNGGGGGTFGGGSNYDNFGGKGCIFGQYGIGLCTNGKGYGSSAGSKYRCGLVFVINGNLTITGTITQNGGDGNDEQNGYGGGVVCGSAKSGGGGAPVFIYYTGRYTNNGSINTSGGHRSSSNSSNGGAGGIKTTKITI